MLSFSSDERAALWKSVLRRTAANASLLRFSAAAAAFGADPVWCSTDVARWPLGFEPSVVLVAILIASSLAPPP